MKYSTDIHLTFFSVDGTPESLRARVADAIQLIKARIEQRADVHIEEITISDVKREPLLPPRR